MPNTTLTPDRKEEIRNGMIDTLNGMGSRFFNATLIVRSWEEAHYAVSLWPATSIRERYGANYSEFHIDVRPKISG